MGHSVPFIYFRISHFLMSITVRDFQLSHGILPLTSGTKFLLAIFELLSHFRGYLFLKLNVDLREEELVKVSTAHWTVHANL